MNISNLKALSIAGPYSWAIARGEKSIELRSWYTNHSGIILLHSSSGAGYESMFPAFGLSRKNCPRFALIGAAKLRTCVEYTSEKLWDSHKHLHLWDEDFDVVVEQYGKYFYGHVFTDAIAFDKPILGIKGSFNYWEAKTPEQKLGFEKAIALLKQIDYF